MATYTNIAKPTSTSYTPLNTVGKQQYDQASIAYDDSSVFYDGVNQSAYTNIAKPVGGGPFTIIAGTATGLIMPPTYAQDINSSSDLYTRISKPN